MSTEQIAPLFDYGTKAGTAISFVFIMILLWEAFRILRIFVEKHFEHVKRLEDQIAENEKSLETKISENEKNSSTAIQALTQTIGTLNSTIQLNNQSILQALSEFKNMNAAIAEIKQATSRCGIKD